MVVSRIDRVLLASVPLTSAMLTGIPIESAAQSQPAVTAIEELVVTARRREESLMSVPLAISAFSKADIESLGAQDLNDLNMRTPGFYMQYSGVGAGGRNDRSFPTLTFRGLSNIANIGSLFIDGAPVSSVSSLAPGDFERIEILNGPQSVYFGRSTYAGAVNYVTRTPGDRFVGRITTEYSSYNSTDATLSLEGPLIAGRLSARVSFHDLDKGGHYRNAADPSYRLGAQATRSGALNLYFTPSEALSVKAFFNTYEDQDGLPASALFRPSQNTCNARIDRQGGNNYICGVVPKISAAEISAYSRLAPYEYGIFIDNNIRLPTLFDPKFNEKPGLRRRANQANLAIAFDFGDGHQLNSITAYNDDKYQIISSAFRDSEQIPNPANPGGLNPLRPRFALSMSFVQGKQRDWSQELRVTSPQERRLRWDLGANYVNIRVPQIAISLINNNGGSVLTAGGSSVTGSKTPAVFGGAYYDLNDRLTLNLEGRYQWDRIYTRVAATGATFERTFKNFMPRATLDFEYSDDGMVYALYSRGTLPGSFRNQALLAAQPANVIAEIVAQVGPIAPAVSPEEMNNYEAGWKGSFFEGRTTAQLAVYHAVITDQQITRTVFLASGGGLGVQTNLGKTRLKGVELSIQAQPTEQISLSGSFGLARPSIRVFECTECFNFITGSRDVTGNRTRNVPEHTGSASAEYTDSLIDAYDWFARADYTYRGTVFGDEANIAETGPQHIVNLKIGARSEALTLEAFVKNLTDDDTYLSLFRATDPLGGSGIRMTLPDKRTFGLRAAYTF
ncbi:MAG: TonB-dependent receptor [Rhodospirillaceae bacterium]|nr:TonB-dependent receptor [Rhodospirillaceae bacterium]